MNDTNAIYAFIEQLEALAMSEQAQQKQRDAIHRLTASVCNEVVAAAATEDQAAKGDHIGRARLLLERAISTAVGKTPDGL